MQNQTNALSEAEAVREITKEVFQKVHSSFKKIINGRLFMAVDDETSGEISFEPCKITNN